MPSIKNLAVTAAVSLAVMALVRSLKNADTSGTGFVAKHF